MSHGRDPTERERAQREREHREGERPQRKKAPTERETHVSWLKENAHKHSKGTK